MTSSLIVLDANVAVKLLHAEPDTDQAKQVIADCLGRGIKILVPEHFLYEVVAVCHRVDVSVDDVLLLFDKLRGSILTVVSPRPETWRKAQEIARDGTPQSGFPSLYDSIYQAVALEAEGLFVTADHRHAAKAHQHGGISLLKDWKGS